MNPKIHHGIRALRALHRRTKLLFALAAAWAPIVLARSPLLALSVLIVASALFFVSVSQANSSSPQL